MQFFAKLHTFVQLWYRTSCQVMTPGTHLGSPRRLRMLVMMSHSISLFTTNDASVVRLSRSKVSTELSVEEEGATLVVTWGVEWNWPKWMWILCQGFVGQIQEGEVELQLVLSSQPDTASMIWLGLQSVCQDLATRNSNLFILFMRDVPMWSLCRSSRTEFAAFFWNEYILIPHRRKNIGWEFPKSGVTSFTRVAVR